MYTQKHFIDMAWFLAVVYNDESLDKATIESIQKSLEKTFKARNHKFNEDVFRNAVVKNTKSYKNGRHYK